MIEHHIRDSLLAEAGGVLKGHFNTRQDGDHAVVDLTRDDGSVLWPDYAQGEDELLAVLVAEQRYLVEQEGRGSVRGKTYVDRARERIRRAQQADKGVGAAFDLSELARRISARDSDWQSLSLIWTHREISPNHGKATTGSRFDCPGWLGEISVWATGETELETVRTSDRSGVNKHYDLVAPVELEAVLYDLVGLVRDGMVPPDAFTYVAR